MNGLFISNLNAVGKELADGGQNPFGSADSLLDVLHDNSVNNVENLVVRYYNNPDVDPKAHHNFIKFLAGESIAMSVVKFPDGMTKQTLTEGVKVEFASDMPSAKYLVCPYIRSEYVKDGVSFDMPLIIKIDDLGVDGVLKGSLLSGRYDAESDSYNLDYAVVGHHYVLVNNRMTQVKTLFFALSDLPDLSDLSEDANYNAFVLQCDCPAIREDAKKGDVFVFGQSRYAEEQVDEDEHEPVLDSWIKLYSLQDKLDKFLNNNNRKIRVLLGDHYAEMSPLVAAYNLNLCSGNLNGQYLTLTQDMTEGFMQTVALMSGEDAEKTYLEMMLVADGIPGFDNSGQVSSLDCPMHFQVCNIDVSTGSPIIRPLNGKKNNAEEEFGYTSYMPKGTKLRIVEHRPALFNSLVLAVNDIKVTINATEYEFKQGECFIIDGASVVPVEFDSFANQFDDVSPEV